MDLNILDLVIIGVTLISAIIGLFRGMTKEAITLITWILAVVFAIEYGETVGALFNSISTDLLKRAVGGFIVFIAILIIGGITNIIIAKFIKVSGFVAVDKMLGAGFGILRALLVVVIVIPLVTDLCVNETWWQESKLIPTLQQFAEFFKTNMPENWSKRYAKFSEKIADK